MAEIALGYIRLDQSGNDHAGEERAIRALAARKGYPEPEVLVVDRDALMPTLLLVQAIRRVGASAVIAPTREHIWTARRGLTEEVALIVVAPEQMWERGHRWPPFGSSESGVGV
ncbi:MULTISPECIES: hypothetical protein [Nocardia]|uniref:Resolvase/invertase-type recombinase catalytic domain-containing protein n=1 Tax=Nocardia sputorum TaxID=2984338 RepID=A0ABN6U665_9NOCA|nr:hypothetical protein [Nocardia sputorum]BDT92150.1 hypothetical protein IFM12275_21260 [Nocardia sputorum]BDU00753.1 hypothetical protein IFM12276_37810 [Nocardia sputorum]